MGRLFNVMHLNSRRVREAEDVVPPEDVPPIPWELVEAHAAQCLTNHDQSPRQLSGRGGLDLTELAAVLDDRRWHKMPFRDALKIVQAKVDAWVDPNASLFHTLDDGAKLLRDPEAQG